jgi:hypothetical protein
MQRVSNFLVTNKMTSANNQQSIVTPLHQILNSYNPVFVSLNNYAPRGPQKQGQ